MTKTRLEAREDTRLGRRWSELIVAPTASIGDVQSCRLGQISGAGAVVLEGGTEASFLGAAFQADGAYLCI